jgi:DinB superfamily
MEKALIDHFEQGGERLAAAIRGLSREEMLKRPPAEASIGLWSIQEIIIHLQDSDSIAIDRMQRVIAEELPLLIGYNETLAAKNLFYDDQSAEDAVTILGLKRKQVSKVLRKLAPEAFNRAGIHNERGKMTLADFVIGYDKHLDYHIGFIQKKRIWLGKI